DQRDGNRLALLYCHHKSTGARELTLILPPQAHLRKAFPAPAAQPAEVIKLQHLASAEHLQAFLGETPVAVGQVMDGAHGTVGELQRDRDLVVGNLQRVVSSV